MDRIRPALSSAEWRHCSSGSVSVQIVGEETHLVVRDLDGDVVSVSGDDEIFSLMALANHALPLGDARKITVTDVAVCRIVLEHVMRTEEANSRLAELVRLLGAKLSALLPDR